MSSEPSENERGEERGEEEQGVCAKERSILETEVLFE